MLFCTSVVSFCPFENQAADTSRKKLEKEVAAFLSMLKNDSVAESKIFIICYFSVIYVLFLYVVMHIPDEKPHRYESFKSGNKRLMFRITSIIKQI